MIGGRIGDDGLMVGNNMMLSIDEYEYDDDDDEEEEEDDDDP